MTDDNSDAISHLKRFKMSPKLPLFFLALAATQTSMAGDSTLDAAIGGGLGGAAGAAIGHELGGRDGAVIGGAIGGATGAAIATDPEKPRHARPARRTEVEYYRRPARNPGHFCPPGQAKKGRC